MFLCSILKEELATILKSVTLHEEALVQYDELDALFSQFVVNGNIKGIGFCILKYLNNLNNHYYLNAFHSSVQCKARIGKL